MKTFNYKMLIMARESRGLTQTELSVKTPGLNQGNLSKIEKGILKISDEMLKSIANQLNYPLSFFEKEEPKSDIHSFYYRKRLSFPKKELMIIESKMNIVRLAIDELLNSVDIPDYLLPSYEPEGNITSEEIARQIRSIMKIPKGPIEKPVEIFEKFGIIVYFLDVNSDRFDGITLLSNNGKPIIYINKNMPNDRKRFTLGHELGHLIMHIPFTNIKDPDLIEREANDFSSEFNMPTIDCRNDLLNLKFNSLGHLKSYWKMSKAAIIYKSKALGTISDQTYKYMNIELSRRGEKKSEKGLVHIDEPQVLNEILKLHLNQLNYSKNELTDVLGLSDKDYQEYFDNRKTVLRIA